MAKSRRDGGNALFQPGESLRLIPASVDDKGEKEQYGGYQHNRPAGGGTEVV